MTKDKAKIKTMDLTNLADVNQIDLSAGYICDVETGICGPTEEIKNENSEEKKNENNNLV